MNFAKIDPRILALGLGSCRVRDILPAAWLIEYTPNKAELEDLLTLEWPAGNVLRYTNALRANARAVRLLLNRTVADTPENRWAVFITVQALLGEADSLFNPHTGRLGMPIIAGIHFFRDLEMRLQKAHERGWLTNEFGCEIIESYLRLWPASLDGLFTLMFNCGHGNRTSLGWYSVQEKAACLKALELTVREDTRRKVVDLYIFRKGDVRHFQTLWERFVSSVQEWQAKFDAKPAPVAPTPHGREAVEAFLQSWGIKNSLGEILAHLDREAQALRDEMRRIEPQLAQWTKGRPETNQALEDTVRWHIRQFVECILVPGGLAQHFHSMDYRFKFMDPAEGGASTFAGTNADGTEISFRDASGDIWDEMGPVLGQVAVHEFVHCLQMKQTLVPSGLAGIVAREGAAQLTEEISLLMREYPNAYAIYGFLRSDLRRMLYASSVWRFHAGYITEAQAIASLVATGMDEARARRVLAPGFASVSQLPMYWLGSRLAHAGLEAMAYAGVVSTELFPDFVRKTGLVLPGHVLIEEVDPFDFDLLVELPDEPIRVRLSQALLR